MASQPTSLPFLSGLSPFSPFPYYFAPFVRQAREIRFRGGDRYSPSLPPIGWPFSFPFPSCSLPGYWVEPRRPERGRSPKDREGLRLSPLLFLSLLPSFLIILPLPLFLLVSRGTRRQPVSNSIESFIVRRRGQHNTSFPPSLSFFPHVFFFFLFLFLSSATA